jgi:hypothetical protein
MRNIIVFATIILTLCLFAANAFAAIPGSSNEIYNGSFDIGADNLDGWTVVTPVSTEFEYLQSMTPLSDWSIAVYQWIDESTNPLWLWNGSKKEIALDAKIKLDPGTGVKFFIEYWDNDNAQSYNDLIGPRTGTISPATYSRLIIGDNSYADWTNVTPLTDKEGNNAWVKDCQPRWLKFYVLYKQNSSITNARVDDLNLTSRCVAIPEPGSFLALGSGIVGLVGFVIRRRRA